MEETISYGEDYKYIPVSSRKNGEGGEVRGDVYYETVQIVNVTMVGDPLTESFVLVDAGMPNSADRIISTAEDRFGSAARPNAVILTHGHFDHVGSIVDLIDYWDVPVYAHELEMPYLTGEKSYPKPDATVEGGLVAKMSPIFPNEPVNLGSMVNKLPSDGTVPLLPDFSWLHTPGHTPGHISLYREDDGLLIAGDAFVTVEQESLYKVLVQKQEISGPPRYYTMNWKAARQSVEKLNELNPTTAITGHGIPMSGEQLSESLDKLVRNFDEIAKPDYGRYVD